MMFQAAINGAYSFFNDSEQALQAYNEFGFHIERDVLDTKTCDILIKEGYNLSGANANNYRPAMMPHRENPAFLQALKYPKVVKIISKLVDGTPVGLQSQFFYCKPGTRGFSLHQDNFFVEADYGVFVSAWIALMNTTPENGGLIIYPGTHKEGLLPIKKLNLSLDPNQDPNANNEETDVPKQYTAHHVSVPRGAALFIHGHLAHGSNSNQSDVWRYVLLNTYIRANEHYRSGSYAQRDQVALI